MRAQRSPAGRIAGFPIRVGDAPERDGRRLQVRVGVNELSGTLVGIDPTRNEVVGSPIAIGGRPRFVALANGSLWVSNFDGNTVTRVSSATRTVISRTRVGRSPWGIAVTPEAIWVVNHDDDTVQPISTSTGEPAGSPIEVGQAPVYATFGYSSLWVTNSQCDSVSRVDLRGRTVVKTIRVGDHPEGISFGVGGVWVANWRTTPSRASIRPRTASSRRSRSATGRSSSRRRRAGSGSRTPATAP